MSEITHSDLEIANEIINENGLDIWEILEYFKYLQRISQRSIRSFQLDIDPENDETYIHFLCSMIEFSRKYGAMFREIGYFTNHSNRNKLEFEE